MLSCTVIHRYSLKRNFFSRLSLPAYKVVEVFALGHVWNMTQVGGFDDSWYSQKTAASERHTHRGDTSLLSRDTLHLRHPPPPPRTAHRAPPTWPVYQLCYFVLDIRSVVEFYYEHSQSDAENQTSGFCLCFHFDNESLI